MPTTSYVQDGERIDYTPATAKRAGDVVVQGELVGVPDNDISASRLGALSLQGVRSFPKATGAGTDLVVGQKVYWDATNLIVSRNPAVGQFVGRVVKAAATTDTAVNVLVIPSGGRSLCLSAEAASTAVTNTVAETAFDNSSLVIPANFLAPGDVIRVRGQGICTATNSTDTLNVKVKLGATIIEATGAVDVANNDIFYFEADIVIRTIGAGGTLVASGIVALGVEGTVTAKPAKLASTAIDTTAAQTLQATATWSVANAGNSCRLDVMNVEILKK